MLKICSRTFNLDMNPDDQLKYSPPQRCNPGNHINAFASPLQTQEQISLKVRELLPYHTGEQQCQNGKPCIQWGTEQPTHLGLRKNKFLEVIKHKFLYPVKQPTSSRHNIKKISTGFLSPEGELRYGISPCWCLHPLQACFPPLIPILPLSSP